MTAALTGAAWVFAAHVPNLDPPAQDDRLAAELEPRVSTDRIVVKLARGCLPRRSPAGGAWQLTASDDLDEQSRAAAALAEQVLSRHGTIDVTPVLVEPAADAALADQLGLDRYYVITVPPESDVAATVAELVALGAVVESAEPDCIGALASVPPNDSSFWRQWALQNTGQTVQGITGVAGADINWGGVWQLGPISPIILAVLDTGISNSHPDLSAQRIPGRNFVTSDPGDTDDNTSQSHGTKCAGVAGAATNNMLGIAGVAPAVRLMPIKVVNGQLALESIAASGLTWAADHGARVATISLSFAQGMSVFHDAVLYAQDRGMLVFAATGNTPGAAISYPARWPEVVAVGATDNRDIAFVAESTGPEMEVVAPGVEVYTTVDEAGNLDGYSWETGTSMATPMVAAEACLILGINPSLSAAGVRRIILETADDLGDPGWDPVYGWGRIDVTRALNDSLGSGQRCIADWDYDGVVSITDIFSYLASWFHEVSAPGPVRLTDLDRNGLTDMTDLMLFISAWFHGCTP